MNHSLVRSEDPIMIVGAGVIGLSIAVTLQKRGFRVTVLDKEGPAAGASAGNAGAFAFTDILPMASPGIMKKAPKWLLDPLGPLCVPPAYALNIAPWMYRFWRACSAKNVAASTKAQTALMDLSKAELEPFLAHTGTLPMLRKNGNLQVYETQAEFDSSLSGWQKRAEHGIEFHHLSASEMAEIQPGLSSQFIKGTFTPGWYSIADPRDYTLALADHFRASGGEILIQEVTALTHNGLQTASGHHKGRVVLAAGAFSHQLAQTLGVKIPLETERGYNTTLPADAFDLRMQITFGGHGFVVTKLSSGLRVGGAVELGGLKLPPNYQRAQAMLDKAARFLPGLKTTGGKQWMGFRPSLPDSLPAIGPLTNHPNVICAFGHGHLGLTQSPATARLVADLLTGSACTIDLSPFSLARF